MRLLIVRQSFGTGLWQLLTNEFVLDIASRALGKHSALIPRVRVDHLGGRLPAQVAGELHSPGPAWVGCRGPHNIICLILHFEGYSHIPAKPAMRMGMEMSLLCNL